MQKITLADIAKFEEEYKGSEEELADLKAAYLDGDGDMNYIMDNVLCAVQGCNSIDNYNLEWGFETSLGTSFETTSALWNKKLSRVSKLQT